MPLPMSISSSAALDRRRRKVQQSVVPRLSHTMVLLVRVVQRHLRRHLRHVEDLRKVETPRFPVLDALAHVDQLERRAGPPAPQSSAVGCPAPFPHHGPACPCGTTTLAPASSACRRSSKSRDPALSSARCPCPCRSARAPRWTAGAAKFSSRLSRAFPTPWSCLSVWYNDTCAGIFGM